MTPWAIPASLPPDFRSAQNPSSPTIFMSAEPARRIVSLLPAATEIAAALGAADRIVGRSHACDHPWEIRTVPTVTRPRIPAEHSSLQIHEAATAALESSQSLFELDVDHLRTLEPDVILTQDQCRICAVTPADLEKALGTWPGRKPRVVSLHPTRLADLWRNVQVVAEVLGAGGWWPIRHRSAQGPGCRGSGKDSHAATTPQRRLSGMACPPHGRGELDA